MKSEKVKVPLESFDVLGIPNEKLGDSKDIINWFDIDVYLTRDLTIDFIREFEDKIDWFALLSVRDIPNEVVESEICLGIDELWVALSERGRLSEEFMERHSDKLCWDAITIWQKYSVEFYYRHEKKLPLGLLSKNGSFEVNDEFLEKHKEHLDWSWLVSRNTSMTEELYEKYEAYVDWDNIPLLQGRVHSESFLERNIHRLCKSTISGQQMLSKGFVERNLEYLDMNLVSLNTSSPKGVREYADRVEGLKRLF